VKKRQQFAQRRNSIADKNYKETQKVNFCLAVIISLSAESSCGVSNKQSGRDGAASSCSFTSSLHSDRAGRLVSIHFRALASKRKHCMGMQTALIWSSNISVSTSYFTPYVLFFYTFNINFMVMAVDFFYCGTRIVRLVVTFRAEMGNLRIISDVVDLLA